MTSSRSGLNKPSISTEDLRFFLVVARGASLAAAARSLDVTASAVTQRLRQLEQRIGVRLLNRTTRRLRVTEEGRLLIDRTRAILADLDDLTEKLSARRSLVGGHLRVIAPLGFGRRYVAPVAALFRRQNPAVNVTLGLSDRPAVTADDDSDLIIHIGELKDSSRVMHRLAPNERFVCAAPSYLAEHDEPENPIQLSAHACLTLRQNDEDVTFWRFANPQRKSFSIRITSAMTSNDGEIVHAWARDGLGVIIRSEWDVADDLKAGKLKRILTPFRLPSANIVALLGARGDRTARANEFLRLLQVSLRPVPWR